MTLWTKTELLQALSDDIIGDSFQDNITIDEVVIDSTKARANTLFVALKGPNNDGHHFLDQVFTNGCNIAIIHNQTAFERYASTHNLILVKDSFKALYSLAQFSRNRSHAKIIAITGSVGKTTTKELLKETFSSQGKTYVTPGNLNNHIGLPLTLCNFAANCDYGIFEIGMNHLNEIKPLSQLTKPHIAVITNVGPVHIENFKNEEEIALAKSEIFAGLDDDGISVINADNKHYDFLRKKGKNVISFGQKNQSDYHITNLDYKHVGGLLIKVKTKELKEISYCITNHHQAYITGSLIALTCLDLLGCDVNNALKAIQNISAAKGRGQMQNIIMDNKHITIIDDSYNASITSMTSGLQHAANLKKALGKKRLVIALGDMLELGHASQQLHSQVIELITTYNIDFAILVGDKMKLASHHLDKNIYKSFDDVQNAVLMIKNILNDGDLLYIKGSRAMRMEKIIESITN